ncbi:MAG: hypothetical protein R3C49_06770 [Planctomycetaceae bacterium]
MAEESSLIYSTANGNAITISGGDADAGASDPLSVTLTADNGTLTLVDGQRPASVAMEQAP